MAIHQEGQLKSVKINVNLTRKFQWQSLLEGLNGVNRFMKRIDSSLVYTVFTALALLVIKLLLTAIPKQLTKDPIFWFWNQTKSNVEKLSIWYQIDQCHFVHTVESLAPYLKLCSLLA